MQSPDDLGIERPSERTILVRDDGAAGRARRVGECAGKAPHRLVADRLRGDACRDDRPRGIGDDRVEDFRQQRRVVVDGAGSVDGIGDAAEFRQHRRDALLGRGMKRRERCARVLQRVSRDGGSASAAGNHDELASDRFVAWSDREQFDGLDEFIVTLDLDDAAAAQEGGENFGIAGERPGMGLHHDLAGRRAPGLKQHQGFASRMGGMGDADQLARILELLDDSRDHRDVGVIDEVFNVVLDRCPDLVAARHEMAETKLAIGHQGREHIRAEAPALGHDCYRTRTQGSGEGAAIGCKTGLHADETETVWPADAHPSVRERPQPRGTGMPVPAFPEARCEDDGRGDAVRVRFLEHVAGRIGGDRDHEAIDRSRKVAHGRKAFAAQHVLVARIHREDLARKAAVPQVGDDIGSAAAALRSAHDRDAFGIEQRAHGFHRL